MQAVVGTDRQAGAGNTQTGAGHMLPEVLVLPLTGRSPVQTCLHPGGQQAQR